MDKQSSSGKPVYALVIETHVELIEPASAQAVSVEVVELPRHLLGLAEDRY